MNIAVETSPQLRELHRQTEVLVAAGWAEAAGMRRDRFRELATGLAPRLPDGEFVLTPRRGLVTPETMIRSARLGGKTGFTTMESADLARFAPVDGLRLPDSPLYLLCGVDAGQRTRGVRPDDAADLLRDAGASPLTLEEGLAVAVQFPRWLVERTCFQMLGSRAGDKRVTGVWVSRTAPRLGWCWGGNPHSWLGMASCTTRLG
ncbi:DUF5701 family protein [Saccharopolyspora rosea]|uniref:DUF5701 family protein n=1 Tax=Saccharopolyspora rosea TaxID=524884 RepID=UPI0021DAA883|nr:DUF5701 family protein [Saccharopolyspora rosea]